MNALRLSFLTVVVAAPLAGTAAPAHDASSSTVQCSAAPLSLVERRISEEAARGLPALIGFVNRTRAIYQLRVVEAVDWIDSERERRTACLRASAGDLSD